MLHGAHFTQFFLQEVFILLVNDILHRGVLLDNHGTGRFDHVMYPHGFNLLITIGEVVSIDRRKFCFINLVATVDWDLIKCLGACLLIVSIEGLCMCLESIYLMIGQSKFLFRHQYVFHLDRRRR